MSDRTTSSFALPAFRVLELSLEPDGGRPVLVGSVASSVDDRGLPAVTFTTPPLAGAGPTGQQALTAGHDCDCRVLGAQDIPRALADRDTRGALELVTDAADTRAPYPTMSEALRIAAGLFRSDKSTSCWT